MTKGRWILLGAITALVVGTGADAVGGFGLLKQAMFNIGLTSSVNRTAYSKLSDWVSVKDFGATGDGVTNDTAAVTLALAVAPTTQVISFPCPGTYQTTTYSTVPCGIYYPPLTATGAVIRSVPGKLFETTSVKDFGAIGDGTTDDTTAMANAATAMANGGTLVFPAGTYKYTASPNWAIPGLRLVGAGSTGTTTTILKFTGTGNAVVFDAGSGSQIVSGVQMENFIIQGNASATNGIYLRSVHHSHFNNIRVTDVSASGLLTNFSVSNSYDTFRVSNNEGAFLTQPVNGIVLDSRALNEQTTASVFINPIIEGVSGTGIKINSGQTNQFHGGTSEGNARGIEIAATYGITNSFFGMDFEVNSVEDVLVKGTRNVFFNCLSAGTFHINGASATENTIDGGYYADITLDGSATLNRIANIFYTGTITDSGVTNLQYGNFKSGTNFDAMKLTGSSGLLFQQGTTQFTGDIYIPNNMNLNFGDDAGANRSILTVNTGGTVKMTGYHSTLMLEAVNGAHYLYDSAGSKALAATTGLSGATFGASSVVTLAALAVKNTTGAGTCTLNGGTPSTCTATTFTGARCLANPQGTTAAAATHTLATSVTTTTLTVTGANGLTDTVIYLCF